MNDDNLNELLESGKSGQGSKIDADPEVRKWCEKYLEHRRTTPENKRLGYGAFAEKLKELDSLATKKNLPGRWAIQEWIKAQEDHSDGR